jgi:hypothetical protein
VDFDVTVRNPFDRDETAVVRLHVPDGWSVEPESREVELEARGQAIVSFAVVPSGPGRLAADLTVGETRFGEQAEAVVEGS